MTAWKDDLRDNASRYLEELVEFLRIPSISSLPEYADDVSRAAQWVARRLEKAGAEQVQILPTENNGHPVVYGQWLHADRAPTVLIYGHFDVQPVDPLSLWSAAPFEPVVKNDRIYARGASDDKGNMLIPILAVESLLRTRGSLPVNVKFFFEGQEEIGSPVIDVVADAEDGRPDAAGAEIPAALFFKRREIQAESGGKRAVMTTGDDPVRTPDDLAGESVTQLERGKRHHLL